MSNNTEKIRMSPAARRLAREKGIDVAELAKIKADDDIVIKASDIDQLEEDAIQLSERMSEIADLLVTLRSDTSEILSERFGILRAENAQKAWERARREQHIRLENWRSANERRLWDEREASRRRFAAISWQAAKAVMDERLREYFIKREEERLRRVREEKRAAAQQSWENARREQTKRSNIWLTDIEDARLRERAEQKRLSAQARWLMTKAEQDESLAAFISEREEKRRIMRANARRERAEQSWAQAKASHDALRTRWLAKKARERAEKQEEERLAARRLYMLAEAAESWRTAEAAMRERADTWIEHRLHLNALERESQKRARALRDWQRAKSLGDRRINDFTEHWEAAQEAAYVESYGQIVREREIKANLSVTPELCNVRLLANRLAMAMHELNMPIYNKQIINFIDFADPQSPIKQIMQPHASVPERIRIVDTKRFAVGVPIKIVSFGETTIGDFVPSESGCLSVSIIRRGGFCTLAISTDSKLMSDAEFVRLLAKFFALLQ